MNNLFLYHLTTSTFSLPFAATNHFPVTFPAILRRFSGENGTMFGSFSAMADEVNKEFNGNKLYDIQNVELFFFEAKQERSTQNLHKI
ncbi:hypothetical protein L1987_49786 [Smallanthus sonchifolius]|uniref:Uncharacterized protein n=1 Tax=Smallanthus sonchifolius TaxID=185202 RepID=A0ACB9FVG5_9ASTR|nr:hypothetical protein L1987_49786 [Smallanthus sonchifolius]